MSLAHQPLHILNFRFEGLQVIEASAGTGKTWTLAMLYLRLLLGAGPGERPLNPPDILVMTFTEAATQELRERIRVRIGEAVRVFRGLEPAPDTGEDEALLALRESRPREGRLTDARRLEAALQWMDEAAIHTIHGWCSRMLRRHAFDSVSLFQQERVEDPQALLQEVARDYWRRWFYDTDAEALRAVPQLPMTPDRLVELVRPLLSKLDRGPHTHLADSGDEPGSWFLKVREWSRRFESAQREAREAWRTDIDRIEAVLGQAVGNDLNRGRYKPAKHAADMRSMRAWSEGEAKSLKAVGRYAQDRLRKGTLNGRNTPEHPAFRCLQDMIACSTPPAIGPLLAHAAQEIRERLKLRKARLAQFDFSDLLQRLYTALHDPGRGAAFAHRLRELYPVALVDEFQDTDPWQYGALSRIYRDADPKSVSLVMIGDPKQAIYRFRGADLQTYLEARGQAAGIHTLNGNFRSTSGLVAAMNHVFRQEIQPFGEHVSYVPVEARKPVEPLRDDRGQARAAMTVWHTRDPSAQGVGKLRQQLARGFATQIVALLGARQVAPADVAVLVRTAKDAQRIRRALAERGVRSVYLSDRDSVFATEEALDLWYVLRAVADPRSMSALRAALATRIFGHDHGALERLFSDEARFEQDAEGFARWQLIWQQQGLLAMLYAVLHEQQIPARLLADRDRGERRLTNLLHLGDLLQKAGQQLQGEAAVVRYLAEQLRDRPDGEGAAQLRLETDEGLVKVVTMHKSKGLEYPVVFVPFAFDFNDRNTQGDGVGDPGSEEAERIAEDRRLLYVAFTRAERALFIGAATRSDDFTKAKRPVGSFNPPKSALSRLLQRSTPDDLCAALAGWSRCEQIRVEPLPEATLERFDVAGVPVVRRPAATPRRRHLSRWRSSSFTALTRGIAHRADGAVPTPGSELDERLQESQFEARLEESLPEPAVPPSAPAALGRYQGLGGGARFGDLLHDLLEWQQRAGWPIVSDLPADPADERAWSALVARRATLMGLTAEEQDRLKEWIGDLARCPLDPAARSGADSLPTLAGIVGGWPEMAFILPAKGVPVATVDRLLLEHIQPGRPRESLTAAALEGPLTGFMDLVFESAGRYYVVDYKSNKLADYSPEGLAQAVLRSRYELQYTLYLLALHRLLKSRLPHYDYDCHIGGAIYLFARGIESPGCGIYRDRPPRILIESLDHLFRGPAP
jgi:exodeoxyribonuclease V beta subunit